MYFKHKNEGIKFYDSYGEIPISTNRIINWLISRCPEDYIELTLKDLIDENEEEVQCAW